MWIEFENFFKFHDVRLHSPESQPEICQTHTVGKSSSSAFQQYPNVWVRRNKEVSGVKEIGSGAADGTSTSAAAAVHKPMDVNDVSDYATNLEDRLDEMAVDFRRSVTMENHWRSASECLKNTFVNNPVGHECGVCVADYGVCEI
jgi:hypothetical protein